MFSKSKKYISGKFISYKIPPKEALLTSLKVDVDQLIFAE